MWLLQILVLGFCDNQRDEELIWKILSQVAPSFSPPFPLWLHHLVYFCSKWRAPLGEGKHCQNVHNTLRGFGSCYEHFPLHPSQEVLSSSFILAEVKCRLNHFFAGSLSRPAVVSKALTMLPRLHCMINAVAQVCLAYRNGEGKVVVVLTQQPKLEMEATFRRIIPAEQRFGTRFVFREGSAIIPDNLRMVAASRAAATIIVSDSSR